MCEMGITPDEIKQILFEPTMTYRSKKFPETTCYRNDQYALATIIDENGVWTIKTALYATQTAWLEAFKMGKLSEDRFLNPNTCIPRR